MRSLFSRHSITTTAQRTRHVIAPRLTAYRSAKRRASSAAALAHRQGCEITSLDDIVAGSPVLVMGAGKASQFHHKVSQDYGTNFVGAIAPNRGGSTFLDRPVFNSLREALDAQRALAISVFVPPRGAADAIIECIEAEVPLIVSVAEGIPTHEQLRIQAALRSQSKSRLIGANCPGMIIPGRQFKLGIQPLAVHLAGTIGIASRSGTISYELASQTTKAGLGQSVVFGLGGDPFPGTRTWEALDWMMKDPATEVICLVGEIGGQMEEEAAAYLTEYRSRPGVKQKPVVGFIAGQTADRARLHGHAGAIWYDEKESAQNKIDAWKAAGITVARHIGEIGELISRASRQL